MNGEKVREFDAQFWGNSSVTVFSLKSGGRLRFKRGDLLRITEDSYGNWYAYDGQGREVSINGRDWKELE